MVKRKTHVPRHRQEDQYGEVGGSQDRDERGGGFGTGLSGGGTAGRRLPVGADVVLQGHVPKFLKDLVRLRGYKPPGAERADSSVNDDADARREEAETWLRAMDEDPTIAKELNPAMVAKVKAVEEKKKGNEAYGNGDLAAAIRSFSTCIELDPENEVYYSNRSAAYGRLEDFEKSLRDAEKVVELKPTWVKGWGRLAAAQYGLGLYPHARVSYEKALELEPDLRILIDGHKQAVEAELNQMEANKHTFNKSRKKAKTSDSRPKPVEKKWVRISYEDEDGK